MSTKSVDHANGCRDLMCCGCYEVDGVFLPPCVVCGHHHFEDDVENGKCSAIAHGFSVGLGQAIRRFLVATWVKAAFDLALEGRVGLAHDAIQDLADLALCGDKL